MPWLPASADVHRHLVGAELDRHFCCCSQDLQIQAAMGSALSRIPRQSTSLRSREEEAMTMHRSKGAEVVLHQMQSESLLTTGRGRDPNCCALQSLPRRLSDVSHGIDAISKSVSVVYSTRGMAVFCKHVPY